MDRKIHRFEGKVVGDGTELYAHTRLLTLTDKDKANILLGKYVGSAVARKNVYVNNSEGRKVRIAKQYDALDLYVTRDNRIRAILKGKNGRVLLVAPGNNEFKFHVHIADLSRRKQLYGG